MSWPLLPGVRITCAGSRHGAAGFALALSELGWHLARRTRVDGKAAAQARAFEQQWYSPAHGSWADLRSEVRVADGRFGYPHFWCHGSVGIGHDRIAAAASDRTGPVERAEASPRSPARARRPTDTCRASRTRRRFDANGSQCHGLGGLIDLFVEAWRVDPDPTLISSQPLLDAFMRNDAGPRQMWRCGVPRKQTQDAGPRRHRRRILCLEPPFPALVHPASAIRSMCLTAALSLRPHSVRLSRRSALTPPPVRAPRWP